MTDKVEEFLTALEYTETNMTYWSQSELAQVREINERVEVEESWDSVTADESALVKQFFKTFNPEDDRTLYSRTAHNLPVEYDEALDEV